MHRRFTHSALHCSGLFDSGFRISGFSIAGLLHLARLGVVATLLSACQEPPAAARLDPLQQQAEIVKRTMANPWYSDAQAQLARHPALPQQTRGGARNIILFVGDGMGISTLTAARIFAGQQRGESGEENRLSFEEFPYTGLIKTYNVDAQTPDSAGTMTAMVSGVKTNAGVLAVDEGVSRGTCSDQSEREVISALELAELAGQATGIVTTARLTHATPAATYAKSAERNWENDGELSDEALAAGCEDIAMQLIHFKDRLAQRYPGASSDGIEVALGGGRSNFLPAHAAFNSKDSAGQKIEGRRRDGYDLTAQWQQHYPQGRYVTDTAGLAAVDPSTTTHLLGLFEPSHMHYEADRHNDVAGEPSLAAMTERAITLLRRHPKGFFLMVEAGRIDHAHHAGNAYNALNDTVALSDAVAKAVAMTDQKDTLILVTADHSHVFTMAGYPKRGNPILGKVVAPNSDQPTLAADGQPYTTLAYANGPGFDSGNHTDSKRRTGIQAGRQNLSAVDTQAPGFHQEALVPLYSETHGGEDVALFGRGPGAALVSGNHEQNMIFHIMNYAAGWLPQPPAEGVADK